MSDYTRCQHRPRCGCADYMESIERQLYAAVNERNSLRRYNEEINAALQGPELRGLAGSHVSMIKAIKVRIAELERAVADRDAEVRSLAEQLRDANDGLNELHAAAAKERDRVVQLKLTRQPDGSWLAVVEKGSTVTGETQFKVIAAALRTTADKLEAAEAQGVRVDLPKLNG